MKDAEDEAFDELAKRQGSWGGGYQAKRKMAADKLQEPVAWNKPDLEKLKHSDNCRYWDEDIYCTCGAIENAELQFWKNKALAQSTQEQRPWVGLTPEDILALFDEHNLYGSKLVEFTRAVETKIKDKNNG